MKTYVLYHGNCMDGFGAALCAWLRMGDDAEFIPCSNDLKVLPPIDDGSRVYILDFSFPREDLVKLNLRVKELVVLDHHKTAAKNLEGLPFVTFDQKKSGARLAWEHFWPGWEVPTLIQYIEDRDLWAWKLPFSREFNAGLSTYEMTFVRWNLLRNEFLDFDTIKIEGAAVLRGMKINVERHCQQVSHVELDLKYKNVVVKAGPPTYVAANPERNWYVVPAVNATAFVDETAEELLQRFPDAPFVGVYQFRANGNRKWSLRAREGQSCLAIAEAFGGGGHDRACAFVEKG